MPVAFISDFGPMPAIERDDYTDALALLGDWLPRPRAILVMSGHWDWGGAALSVTGATKPKIIYDYFGFPSRYYNVKWPCTGAPDVAVRAADLLTAAGWSTKVDPMRGIDHGAWVPLSRVYPDAKVPVVQLTVPAGEHPGHILEVGRALKPLRDEGVLIVASGTLIHNLRLVHFQGKDDPPDSWAALFDHWIAARMNPPDIEELVHYEAQAPHARLAAPTTEHFDPLFFALGAAESEPIRHFYRGVKYGNGGLRIFALGEEVDNLVPQAK